MTLVSEAEAVAEAVPVGEADDEAAAELVGRGLLVADGLADGDPEDVVVATPVAVAEADNLAVGDELVTEEDEGVDEPAPEAVPEAVVIGVEVAVSLPIEEADDDADGKVGALGLAEAVEDPDRLPWGEAELEPEADPVVALVGDKEGLADGDTEGVGVDAPVDVPVIVVVGV